MKNRVIGTRRKDIRLALEVTVDSVESLLSGIRLRNLAPDFLKTFTQWIAFRCLSLLKVTRKL
jgi:hypothetical protein